MYHVQCIVIKIATVSLSISEKTKYYQCKYLSLILTFPNEPCPKTLSRSNCDGSALSWPSACISVMLISRISESSCNIEETNHSVKGIVYNGASNIHNKITTFLFSKLIGISQSNIHIIIKYNIWSEPHPLHWSEFVNSPSLLYSPHWHL